MHGGCTASVTLDEPTAAAAATVTTIGTLLPFAFKLTGVFIAATSLMAARHTPNVIG